MEDKTMRLVVESNDKEAYSCSIEMEHVNGITAAHMTVKMMCAVAKQFAKTPNNIIGVIDELHKLALANIESYDINGTFTPNKDEQPLKLDKQSLS